MIECTKDLLNVREPINSAPAIWWKTIKDLLPLPVTKKSVIPLLSLLTVWTVWTKVPRRNKKAKFAITAVLNWFLTSVMFLPMTAVSTYLSLLELPGTRLIWSKNVGLYYLDTSKHHDTEERFSAVLHVKQSRKLKCRWHCIKRLCALVMITLGTQPCPLWAICESHTGKVKPLDGVRSPFQCGQYQENSELYNSLMQRKKKHSETIELDN